MKKNMLALSGIALVLIIVAIVLVNQKQVNREFNPIVPQIPDQLISNSSTASQQQINTESYTLEINSLNLSAPVIMNVDGNDQETYLKALENGVAHMAKSALPGNSGNTVIFGHSSYYTSKPGHYKTIFAKLNKLNVGDKITLKSNKNRNYTVTEKKIVKPDDVSIVSQVQSQHQLTLITCWPVGTVNNRFVIVASLDQNPTQ